MAWYGTDYFPADWLGPEWHDELVEGFSEQGTAGALAVDTFAGSLVFGAVAQGSVAEVTVSAYAGELDTFTDAWFGEAWDTDSWYATDWYPAVPTGPQQFSQAGASGSLTVSGFAGVFQTAFDVRGTAASLGVTTYYPGFLPDAGGILDNDSDPDGDPLSYQIVSAPEAGTFTAYAGGAFTWDPTGIPDGRYQFTYQLYAGGEPAATVGTVWLEYGNVFAETTVQGFAGQMSGFVNQGTQATVTVTGFSGTVETAFVEQGTVGSLAIASYAGSVIQGLAQRGDPGTLDPQGFAGLFVGTFVAQGEAASVDLDTFAGELTLTDFLNEAGTAGTLTVSGYAGFLGRFDEQGTAAGITVSGLAGLLQVGFAGEQGAAGTLTVSGFAPLPIYEAAKPSIVLVPVFDSIVMRQAQDITVVLQ